MPSAELPESVRRLLWGVDLATIDRERHSDFIMERVMSRGTWEAMQWLRRAYPRERLTDYVRRKGAALAPRDEAYWGLIAGVAVPARVGGGRPSWAG